MTTRDLAQVAAPREQQTTLTQFIDSMRGEMARALPKHMDADRMARLALTVVRKTPKLAMCNQASFGAALMTATALGLEPGVNDEAYLIPHEDRRNNTVECTLVVGYQGFVKLFWQHPLARHIDAQVVYANDFFDYAYGLDPYLTHKPAVGNRGDMVQVYAVAALSTGAKAFTVLSLDEVKQLRGGKVGPDARFKGGDPMHWMERKTAIRQLVKLLPKSVTLTQALQVDEQQGSVLAAQKVPQQITAHADIAIDTDDGVPVGVDAVTGEVVGDGWGDVEVAEVPR